MQGLNKESRFKIQDSGFKTKTEEQSVCCQHSITILMLIEYYRLIKHITIPDVNLAGEFLNPDFD